ncbi:MAG: packaged DNA stabilization protein gp10 [Citrobacter amalonaticus]|jgi:hypothetical protein|nr:packaged DNA stabilization protein gp10 [Citrobacter amalonaticus]
MPLNRVSTITVDKILRSYSDSELASAMLEAVKFDGHELLLVHLPREVLCFDAGNSDNGPQWNILKSGPDEQPHSGDWPTMRSVYRAVDFIYENGRLTVGDKSAAQTGVLIFDKSAQYGQPTEHIICTPMIKADNAILHDFEVEGVTGSADQDERIFLSATTDGVMFGQEKLINSDGRYQFDRRIRWNRIGRVRKNIGMRLRIITTAQVTLSGARLEVG